MTRQDFRVRLRQIPIVGQWLCIGLLTLCCSGMQYVFLLQPWLSAMTGQHTAPPTPQPPAVQADTPLADLQPGCDMSFIRQTAQGLQLSLLLSEPENRHGPQGQAESSARLLATGHYQQLQTLLAVISSDRAALIVDELQLSRANQGLLDMQAQIHCLPPLSTEATT